MIISDIKLKKYEINLNKPLWVKGFKITCRHGIIIMLKTSEGEIGYGEVSPLPNFHQENFKEAAGQLIEIKDKIIRYEIDENLFTFNKQLSSPFENLGLFPSVQFGLEMALLNIFYSKKNYSFFSREDAGKITVNKLIPKGTSLSKKYVKEIINDGFKSIKIKVGHNSPDVDIDRVLKLKSFLPQNISIRLDANGSWSLEDAIYFVLKTGKDNIEYIEDPLNDLRKLKLFYHKTRFPIAIDESLLEFCKNHIFNNKIITAVVLKPSLIGGFFKTAYFINKARSKHIKVILSNTLQTGPALSAIALFAAQMGLYDTPMGLDTLQYFHEDLLKEYFPIENGEINLFKLIEIFRKIRLDLLLDLQFNHN
ncbi:MAG: o-succinylbenzoate synthase [Actinobacteria bacterium]|nr:o-succinylbenzoate synthase [Actinomycetota bacterium]